MLEVARIGRAHGLRGEVAVTLLSDRTDRLEPGSELTGDGRTFRVVAGRRHGRGWLVHFDGIDDRDTAESLRGLVLHAAADEDAEGLWVHRIIGLEVVDVDGVPRGRITAVQENPAHDLLVLDDGTLVPAVFIVSADDRVVVDAPDGLFA